ncbi:MAG TPA: MFS transporter, partial [Chloroflexota bacterium]|nr:MFS transporter [Chloroflexota bacterium]
MTTDSGNQSASALVQPVPFEAPSEGPRRFFGHPQGLAYLTATEAWAAFALYGTLSLLVLYMVSHLLLPTNAAAVAGLQGLTSFLEVLFGQLTTVALASLIFGLFAGLICFTPLLGGLLADRWLGQRLTVTVGAVLMIAGYALMVLPQTFLPALFLLILGSGCITGNIKAQLSGLYTQTDSRRPSGFAVGLIGINAGAFLGPMVCGTIGELYGWALGFGAAGIGMASGLVVYLAGSRHFPKQERGKASVSMAPAAPRASADRTLAALGIIMLNVFYYGAYNQTFNMFPLWVRGMVDRQILGFEIPVTWFLAADALFAMVATIIIILLWQHQARHRSEPHDLSKLMIGFALMTCAFSTLVAAEKFSDENQVSAGWCVVFFFFTATAAPFIW